MNMNLNLRMLMCVGVRLDEESAQIVPMFVKEVDGGGFAFFNWTSFQYTGEGTIGKTEIGHVKHAALQAVHTKTTKEVAFCHEVTQGTNHTVPDEIEVLINKLGDGDRVLFCIEGDADDAGKQFYAALGFDVERGNNGEGYDSITHKECGITDLTPPFAIVLPKESEISH